MDQAADDPSSLSGESSRGTGSVWYIAFDISLTEKAWFDSHPSLLRQKKSSVRDSLT